MLGKIHVTDNEIIKALECCQFAFEMDKTCDFHCPMCGVNFCQTRLLISALSLINRQKAEIERLNSWVVSLEDLCETKSTLLTDANWSLLTAKAEAIKEFAERLKINITMNNTNDGYLDYAVDYNCLIEDVDDLVKEMVGEDDG